MWLLLRSFVLSSFLIKLWHMNVAGIFSILVYSWLQSCAYRRHFAVSPFIIRLRAYIVCSHLQKTRDSNQSDNLLFTL